MVGQKKCFLRSIELLAVGEHWKDLVAALLGKGPAMHFEKEGTF
jgi:hypothetical protein